MRPHESPNLVKSELRLSPNAVGNHWSEDFDSTWNKFVAAGEFCRMYAKM